MLINIRWNLISVIPVKAIPHYARYKYNDKKNAPAYGGEKYFSNSINTDIKYNILQNTSLQGKLLSAISVIL